MGNPELKKLTEHSQALRILPDYVYQTSKGIFSTKYGELYFSNQKKVSDFKVIVDIASLNYKDAKIAICAFSGKPIGCQG
jgi:hypothetical protein